ncbi:glypican-4 [Nasonia vitripennis]|uniref:Glypican-6 n=1 Tax=Nasonia vitripennis TaxID=7425 RepID=A0A7M7GHR0_NASVI|nr:glypican-4 [Nasonia vitripennis]
MLIGVSFTADSTTKMLRVLILFLGLVAATSTLPATELGSGSKPLSCDAVRPYFEEQGFPASDIPKEPISSRELKTCGGISSGGEVCCSADMEIRLQARARDKHDKATKDTLQRLQNILHTRATKFHEFFNKLLKGSKKSFHEMFKKTYGILYEQNAYVFIDLFMELEKYYAKGLVDLDDVMDTFFNTLYQKMFTVLNSQYKFDSKYLECVGHHMKEMRPFGDVPQKLGVQIKRSFIATRAFSQALTVAADVLKNMQQLKPSSECAAALTRMTVCPSCSGISGSVLACNDMCENVMMGCLAQHAALDADWNHFVEAVDKVADRLLGPFNIEMLVRPINLKISEAIMNFQESSSDVSQRVFTGCGRPVLGRRRRRAAPRRNHKEIDDGKSLSFEEPHEERRSRIRDQDQDRFVDEGHDDHDSEHDMGEDEDGSSSVSLDKLVKEIKQRIRDSRQFWLYLPYNLCNDGLVVPPSNTNDCWNGTHVDKYIYPLSSNGEFQSMNPEVRASGPRINIVREQVFALTSITNRLRLAFNGHDVDWFDTEETYASSGSGSGSGSPDDITDDEDGFEEEGSGSEPPARATPSSPHEDSEKPKERVEDDLESSSTQPSPSLVEVTESERERERVPEVTTDEDTRRINEIEPPQLGPDKGSATTTQRMSLSRALTTYLLPIVVVWFGGCLTDWL